jgi:predicted NAD/FAD-dependent oxidoreductase
MTSSSRNPLEWQFRGFVAISNRGPDGLAVHAVGSRSAQSLRDSLPRDYTISNLQRVRALARDEHDWDITSEDDLAARDASHAGQV